MRFVFTTDGPFVGVDLDDCRDPERGATTDRVTTICTRLAYYTEVSPSDTGLDVTV